MYYKKMPLMLWIRLCNAGLISFDPLRPPLEINPSTASCLFPCIYGIAVVYSIVSVKVEWQQREETQKTR